MRDILNRLGSARFRVGFILFIVMTGLVILFACPNLSACPPRNSAFAVIVTTVTWIAVLVSPFVLAGGWRLFCGFLVAMLFGGISTGGMTTRLWKSPMRRVAEAASPVTKPVVQASRSGKLRTAWVNERKYNPIPPVLGFRMSNTLQQCANSFRRTDASGSFPRTREELESQADCVELSSDRIDRDSVTARRYQLEPLIDIGWRWSYKAVRTDDAGRVTGFQLRVEPDPLLEKPGPVYVSDETGLVLERLAPDKPATAVGSIAPMLVRLRECMMRIPAERERRAALQRARSEGQQYYGGGARPAFDEGRPLCGEIGKRLSTYNIGGEEADFSLTVHDQTTEIQDLAAVYRLRYESLDGIGFDFHIYAAPTATTRAPIASSGVRRYYLAPDGSVHFTRDERQASVQDPLVPACELSPESPCVAPRD